MGCGGVLVTYKATEQPAAVKSRTVDGCCWMGVEVIASGKKVVGLIEPIARSGHYTDLYTHTQIQRHYMDTLRQDVHTYRIEAGF